MTKRWGRTSTPEEEWYLKASTEAIALHSWAMCNNQGNQAGVYTVNPAVIFLYVKIPPDKLVETFAELSDVIEWFPDYNIIWLKNFLYEQNKGIKWLAGAGRTLAECNQPDIIQIVLDYNEKMHHIVVPMPSENNDKPFIEMPKLSNETRVIMKKWEADIGATLTQLDLERLIQISDEYELARIIAAIDETKRRNGRSVKYLEKVLEGDNKEETPEPVSTKAGEEETF